MPLESQALTSSSEASPSGPATPAADSASEVVICIPAFNEAKTIGSIVWRCRGFGNHVLVCDDGSTDETSQEAAVKGAIVVRHPKNLGKGAALRTLLQESLRFDPDVVVTLDGDGQHDPSDIPRLVAPVLNGTADVVIGCRFNGENRIPLYRRIGNYALTVMTNWKAGTSIRDTQSGFRSYSSKVVPHISIDENGMGVDSQILVQAAREGFRIEEQNVSVSYQGDTSTFNPLSHILRVTWSLARGNYRGLRRSSSALWILVSASLVLALLGLTFALVRFSWMGLAISTLTVGVGSLAIVLGPTARLIRWIRRGK